MRNDELLDVVESWGLRERWPKVCSNGATSKPFGDGWRGTIHRLGDVFIASGEKWSAFWRETRVLTLYWKMGETRFSDSSWQLPLKVSMSFRFLVVAYSVDTFLKTDLNSSLPTLFSRFSRIDSDWNQMDYNQTQPLTWKGLLNVWFANDSIVSCSWKSWKQSMKWIFVPDLWVLPGVGVFQA